MQIYNDNNELTNEAMVVITTTINAMAGRYRFGYHTIEDMRQQCWTFVLSQLYRYDGKRSLAAFVGTILITRSFNYKRDTYHRPQKPCLRCPFFDKVNKDCTLFQDKSNCDKHEKWRLLNEAKRNLHHFAPMECAAGATSEVISHEDAFANSELINTIRAQLTDEENLIVGKYLNGEKIAKRVWSNVITRLQEISIELGIE